MAKSKVDIMKMDLYGILGVGPEATEKEIVKAYRKKALKCHPDKNPDNPKAAELFHELSNALKVLTDPSAKAAYDNVLRAKKQADERNKALDSKRKKLKDDLEAREKKFAEQRKTDEDTRAQQNLLAEVERLRKEGSKLLEQEQKYMTELLNLKNANKVNEEEDSDSNSAETPKIKIRWKANLCASYDEEDLRLLFGRYGEIANILVSSKKKGSAIIEFVSYTPMLKLAEQEQGTNSNPVTVTWLSGKPPAHKPDDKQPPTPTPTPTFSSATTTASVNAGFDSIRTGGESKDFESLVLMRMRQAEERKRLIEQMQKEDEEEDNKKGSYMCDCCSREKEITD